MKWGSCSEDATKESIADESVYNNIQFVKNYIHQFLDVFPETIINKVDFQNAVSLPKYWNLSFIKAMTICFTKTIGTKKFQYCCHLPQTN
jgi:hypothetical protein